MPDTSSSAPASQAPEQLIKLAGLLNEPHALLQQLELVAQTAAELTGSDHADITLFDPFLRRHISPRSNRVFMHQGDDDAAAWIRNNRTQLLVPDLNYAASDDDLILYNRDIASYLGVPIIRSGIVEGALLIFSRLPRSFEAGELELLTMLADMASLAINQHRLQLDNEEASRILLRLSLTDPATGVATRHQFEQLLAREWHRALAEGLPLSIMQVQVQLKNTGFDAGGRTKGEVALARAARILQASLYRSGDVIARLGELRLAVLLPETDETGAMAIARRLRRDVTRLMGPASANPEPVSLVIGISSYDALKMRHGPRFQPGDLAQQAEAALELASTQVSGSQLQALSLI